MTTIIKRCLCCTHWNYAFGDNTCADCLNRNKWRAKESCKGPTGELLCATCKHAEKESTHAR